MIHGGDGDGPGEGAAAGGGLREEVQGTEVCHETNPALPDVSDVPEERAAGLVPEKIADRSSPGNSRGRGEVLHDGYPSYSTKTLIIHP